MASPVPQESKMDDQTIANHDEIEPREVYPTIDYIMADDDANDPLLDSYQ